MQMLGFLPPQPPARPPGAPSLPVSVAMPVGAGASTRPLWLPVHGVPAIKCFHQLANPFWVKAERFSAVAAWNGGLALSRVCYSRFRMKGAVGPAPKRSSVLAVVAGLSSTCLVLLGRSWGAVPGAGGRVEVPVPGSSQQEPIPQASLLPQPWSPCGDL